jgi:amino acid transporter
MRDQSAAAVARVAPAARLEPDAIGAAQDTVIGMANAAPAVSVGLTLAALAGATAYGSGPVIVLTAIPMLIIANAYRRLNMWNANCGASFEWVGRAISPYLGFLTGWLMIAGSLIGSLAGVVVLAPSVLAVFGSATTSTASAAAWPNIVIATGVTLVMLVIAIVGIRITARTQVGMAVVEYVILGGLAIAGLAAVLYHHPGTFPASRGWLSPAGIGGRGSAAGGFLLAVFMYTGWDGTVYVNEEVKHRRTNPGRAAMLAVAFLAVIFTLATVGLQGAVSPARLQAHSTSALVYVAGALGGAGWAKVMALALALSVIASTGTGIVIIARIVYGMASRRVLPGFLASVSPRFKTPAAASLVVGLTLIGLTWLYLLTTSLQNAFNDLIGVTGLLYAAFYILTALATIAYYRRRVLASARDALTLGILPLAAAGFLAWILARSLQSAPASQAWSLGAIIGIGVILMLVARFGLRSPFFQIRRESDAPGTGNTW